MQSILLRRFCFVAWVSKGGTLLRLEGSPVYAAIRTQRECDLLVECSGTAREDQRLDLHLPALQIRLREQCIPFRSRFHVEDHDPSRLPNEVIMEDCQRQGRVADEGV